MNISVKQELQNYIRKNSELSVKEFYKNCTTNQLSKELKISRSLASQYLNELFREKTLIKINERPVIFLDRASVELKVHHSIDTDSFDSISSFLEQIQNDRKNFRQAIGYEGSLKECIKQVQTVVHYPGKGLPVLITGPEGCGKSFFANLIKEYYFDNHILPEEAGSLVIPCKSFDKSQDMSLEKKIFGYVEKNREQHMIACKGAIEQVRDGLLILDDIVSLSESCQEKLVHYLDKGEYTRVGDGGKILERRTKILFVLARQADTVFSAHLLSRFPVIIELPSLDERTMHEKQELILYFFRQEELDSGRKIKISKKAVQALIEQCSSLEILKLRQLVRQVFARKLWGDSREVHLYFRDVVFEDQVMADQQEESLLSLDEFFEDEKFKIQNLAGRMEKDFLTYRSGAIALAEWKRKLFAFHKEFNDYAVFEVDYMNKPYRVLEKTVQNVSDYIRIHFNLEVGGYTQAFLVKYYYLQSYILNQCAEEISRLEDIEDTLKQLYPQESALCGDFTRIMLQNCEISSNALIRIMMTVSLNLYNETVVSRKTLALVLCHGNSTATSLANVVNLVLAEHIFDCFDMPFDTEFQSIVKKVQEYLKDKKSVENLLVAVDTGSLTGILENLAGISKFNVGIINNVSTGLLLDIGEKLQKKMPFQKILKSAAQQNISQYSYLGRQNKEKAILFVWEGSADAAERVRHLFEKSIPKATDLRFITCDYASLKREKQEHELFRQYDVLFIEGIFDPEIPEIQFFPLGEIVKFNVSEQMDESLSVFLNREELEIFHGNLLKNFSLENLVETLTILNPNKLLDMVADAVEKLSIFTNCKFRESTLIGLYVHVCCFVERMVTRTPVLTYSRLDDFVSEQEDFIQKVRESFNMIMLHYHIEIPDSEAAYIYEYIKSDLYGKGEKK